MTQAVSERANCESEGERPWIHNECARLKRAHAPPHSVPDSFGRNCLQDMNHVHQHTFKKQKNKTKPNNNEIKIWLIWQPIFRALSFISSNESPKKLYRSPERHMFSFALPAHSKKGDFFYFSCFFLFHFLLCVNGTRRTLKNKRVTYVSLGRVGTNCSLRVLS